MGPRQYSRWGHTKANMTFYAKDLYSERKCVTNVTQDSQISHPSPQLALIHNEGQKTQRDFGNTYFLYEFYVLKRSSLNHWAFFKLIFFSGKKKKKSYIWPFARSCRSIYLFIFKLVFAFLFFFFCFYIFETR